MIVAIATPGRVRAVFAWAVWFGMTGFAWWFVRRYGWRIPVFDDYFYLGFRLNPSFPSWADLWAQMNEHRYPLPKLVTWVTARLCGPGPKTQQLVDLALVSAATAGLLYAARQLRGRSSPADAFLPIILLSVGQWENFLWAVQVNFLLPLSIQVIALALLVGVQHPVSVGRAIVIGACASGLTLCGMAGLLTAAPLGAWLIFAGWTSRGYGRSATAAVIGLLVIGLVGAHFIGYERIQHDAPTASRGQITRYAVRIVGGAWGPAADALGPAESSGWPPVVGVLTVAWLGLTAARVVAAAIRPHERLAGVGMLAFPVGFFAVLVGIAYGRAGMSGGLLAPRYVTLVTPLLVWSHLAWLRFGSRSAARLATGGLFVTALAVAWPNAAVGLGQARDQHLNQSLIERDITLGVPPSGLVEHHGWHLFPPNPAYILPHLSALRAHNVAPFGRLANEPAQWNEVPAGWRVVAAWPPADPDGWHRANAMQAILLTVTADRPEQTTAVRLKYSFDGSPQAVSGIARWVTPLPDGTTVDRVVRQPLSTAGERLTKLLWLGRGVSQVDIQVQGIAAVRVDGVDAFTAE